jgi:hypothetical protein
MGVSSLDGLSGRPGAAPTIDKTYHFNRKNPID